MKEIFKTAGVILFFVLLFSFVLAIPVMYLWNWIVFGKLGIGVEFGYWESWGLLMLTTLLFKGGGK